MWLRRIGAVPYDFRRRLAGNGPMQLVLHGPEEDLGDFGFTAVIDAALLIDIGDLQIEAPFARPDFADALEQFIEIILGKTLAGLQPLVIEDEAFDNEIPEDRCCPDTKLGRLPAVDAITDSNDGVEIVKFDFARNLSTTLVLDY